MITWYKNTTTNNNNKITFTLNRILEEVKVVKRKLKLLPPITKTSNSDDAIDTIASSNQVEQPAEDVDVCIKDLELTQKPVKGRPRTKVTYFF